jgi:hypothetical protein
MGSSLVCMGTTTTTQDIYEPRPLPTAVPKPKAPNGPQAYRGNGNHSWEIVDDSTGRWPTNRLRVPGGWLYRYGDGMVVFVPVPSAVGYVI